MTQTRCIYVALRNLNAWIGKKKEVIKISTIRLPEYIHPHKNVPKYGKKWHSPSQTNVK
jgi:hypothetical protein